MKLCVFQGTFNPIHNAHMRVADFVMDKYGFDKLLFVPAYNPPHKEGIDISALHRFKMVELAIGNKLNVEVSDIEYKRKGVSYTYLTICELLEIYKINAKINFIIGTDAFERIESWYEADKLKSLVHFIVFKRENDFKEEKFEYLRKKGYDFSIEMLNFEDISSSLIREKVRKGESIGPYVNKKVEEYIKQNEIYRT